MKNTILLSTIFTLVGTQVYAESTQTIAPPPQTPSTSINAPAPAQPLPQAPGTTQPTPAPMINCDYKIPAEIKKIDQKIVLTWSENAVTQAFSFDPASIDSQMQKLQPCFTEQGWTGFSAALQKSGNIEAIKSQKLNVTSQIDGQTLITDTKDNQWKITLPIAVVYQNDKEKVSQLLSVDLTVSRKTNGDLGITQMIAAPRGTVTTKKPEVPAAPPTNTPPPTTNAPVIIGKPH